MTSMIHSKKIKKLFQKPTDNPKPDNFKDNKTTFIRYQFRQHFWRWLRYSTIGAVTTGLGFLLLYLIVTTGGLKPIFGYLIENALMLQLGFLLNRYLTFSDRETNWIRSLLKWYAARSSMFAVGQGIFFLLVSMFGLQYMLASLTIALGLGMIDYVICNKFTFSSRFKPAYSPAVR